MHTAQLYGACVDVNNTRHSVRAALLARDKCVGDDVDEMDGNTAPQKVQDIPLLDKPHQREREKHTQKEVETIECVPEKTHTF